MDGPRRGTVSERSGGGEEEARERRKSTRREGSCRRERQRMTMTIMTPACWCGLRTSRVRPWQKIQRQFIYITARLEGRRLPHPNSPRVPTPRCRRSGAPTLARYRSTSPPPRPVQVLPLLPEKTNTTHAVRVPCSRAAGRVCRLSARRSMPSASTCASMRSAATRGSSWAT